MILRAAKNPQQLQICHGMICSKFLRENGYNDAVSISFSFQALMMFKNLYLALSPFDVELYDGKICKLTLPADYFGYKGDDFRGFAKFLIKKYSIDYDEDISKIASDRITLRDQDSTWFMLISNGMTFGFVIADIPVLFSAADETPEYSRTFRFIPFSFP